MDTIFVEQLSGIFLVAIILLTSYLLIKFCFMKLPVEGRFFPEGTQPWIDDNISSFDDAKKWLIEDIDQAQKRILIVTAKGENSFWGDENVVSSFHNAHERGVKITFLVGPMFYDAREVKDTDNNNSEIVKLASGTSPIIELRVINNHPDYSLHIIDDKGIYVTPCLKNPPIKNEDKRRYTRIWNVL